MLSLSQPDPEHSGFGFCFGTVTLLWHGVFEDDFPRVSAIYQLFFSSCLFILIEMDFISHLCAATRAVHGAAQ